MLVKISAEMYHLSRIANLRFCFIHKYLYNLYSSLRIKLAMVIVIIIDIKFSFAPIFLVTRSKCVSDDFSTMKKKFR